jgi:glycosyltransferase involved in cell wall biosynthesis
MRKILIVSTVSRQFYLFEQGNIEVLKSLGYEVHAAANFSDENERLNGLDIIRHPFDIQRSPFSFLNFKAYKQLKKIMKSEKFDAVHCHSPMGGVLGRLAAKSVGVSSIIYTAHGFHFYKGSPLISWLAYYPIEKLLAKFTDVLVTINKEDYRQGQKFKVKRVVYVPGIGLNTDKYQGVPVNKDIKRSELGLPIDAFVLLSVGELNKNKNHEVIIRALARIKSQNIYYIICGQGSRKEYLKELSRKLGVEDKVRFLGFRNDLAEIYNVSDVFAFPSFREGLSVSLMEAMSAGLPIVCSSIRGNIDLIVDKQEGYLLEPNDIEGFAVSILELKEKKDVYISMGLRNVEKIKGFSKEVVLAKMKQLYESLLLKG